MKIGFLTLFIACATALFSFFQFTQTKQALQSTHQNLIQLEDELNNKIERIEKAQHASLSQVQPIPNPTAPEPNKIAAFEIDTLIYLAASQLQAEQDLTSPLRLLERARSQIQALHDAAQDPLLHAIEQDLQTLRAAQPGNTLIAWQSISTLIDETQALLPRHTLAGMQSKAPTDAPVSTAVPNAALQPTWQSMLYNSLATLKDLIKIRKHAKPLEPLLSETDKNLIQQQLRLLLEQLRLAASTRNSSQYARLIKDTQQWLIDYYDPSDPKVMSFAKSLDHLTTMPLDSTPALSCLPALARLRS